MVVGKLVAEYTGFTGKIFNKEKIQVRFPFVRQSYESFQVRKLATNLNEYLSSLHDIEVKKNIYDYFVSMANKDEIEAYIDKGTLDLVNYTYTINFWDLVY